MRTLQSELEDLLKENGASLVGFADMRGIPAGVAEAMPFAVSIAHALNPAIIQRIGTGPTDEYYTEYDRANKLLARLAGAAASLIAARGFGTLVIEPTVKTIDGEMEKTLRTPLPHKTAATRAGLGWIGKNALLVTETFGSAVRFATVLTEAEFDCGDPRDVSRCGDCTGCIEACPSHAPSGRNWKVGMDRDDFLDVRACYETCGGFRDEHGWDSAVCGICIAACPWTKRYVERET